MIKHYNGVVRVRVLASVAYMLNVSAPGPHARIGKLENVSVQIARDGTPRMGNNM